MMKTNPRQDLKASSSSTSKPLASFTGKGLTSRRSIPVRVYAGEKGSGIAFSLPDIESYGLVNEPIVSDRRVFVPATHEYVINTTRNTALGIGRERICFVEHIMCALALCNLTDVVIEVDGPELPMGNGSCDLWIEMIRNAGLVQPPPQCNIELKEPIYVGSADRMIMAIPDDFFSVTYLLDFDHPQVGKIWNTWNPHQQIDEIGTARTFGSQLEHEWLGFDDEDVLSYTDEGFTMPFRFKDEPVRHKLLDLVGDLFLIGVNPLCIKAKFISIRGGHALDVDLVKRLAKAIK